MNAYTGDHPATATVVSGNAEVSDPTFTESGTGGADAAKAKTTDKQ